jgi:hypothetical protein
LNDVQHSNLRNCETNGSPTTSEIETQLSKQKGICLMQPTNIRDFGATGHATLYTGTGSVGGADHCYFTWLKKMILFKLN